MHAAHIMLPLTKQGILASQDLSNPHLAHDATGSISNIVNDTIVKD